MDRLVLMKSINHLQNSTQFCYNNNFCVMQIENLEQSLLTLLELNLKILLYIMNFLTPLNVVLWFVTLSVAIIRARRKGVIPKMYDVIHFAINITVDPATACLKKTHERDIGSVRYISQHLNNTESCDLFSVLNHFCTIYGSQNISVWKDLYQVLSGGRGLYLPNIEQKNLKESWCNWWFLTSCVLRVNF